MDEYYAIGSKEFENCVKDQDHTSESYCVETYNVNETITLTEDDWLLLAGGG